MITREDYNRALDIVEAYNKQISIIINNQPSKTKVGDWISVNNCSGRLSNTLRTLGDVYIEDINPRAFARVRNAGACTWREFTDLRVF